MNETIKTSEKKIIPLKEILLITCILFLLFSCDLFNVKPVPGANTSKQFWAYNYSTKGNYRITAELLAEGIYCDVWVEKNSGVNASTAQEIAYVYDNNIYYKMISVFGFSNANVTIPYNESNIAYNINTMDLADILGNGDGKLTILLLDIKDGYDFETQRSYIDGYFWAGDLYKISGSNRCDMIYIDTYPGVPGGNTSNMTLAHEMQHLMNFVTGLICREYDMDLWINEGLSAAAEWVYADEHPMDKLSWFQNNGNGNNIKGLIDKGNNFFVWGNREDESIYANLDDYSTVYLFFQWLRLQTDAKIYKDIISSQHHDHNAVTSAFYNRVEVTENNWETLLKTWLTANYINTDNDLFGYKDDPVLHQIRIPAPLTIEKFISLFPGEGVYSQINEGFNMPSQQGNIRYAEISENILLTYNKNVLNNKSPEEGLTTGSPIEPNIPFTTNARFSIAPYNGPYRIDAGYFHRQNQTGRNLIMPLNPVIGIME